MAAKTSPLMTSLGRSIPSLAVATVLALGLAGCSSLDKLNPSRLVSPYRADVGQGNLVTEDQVSQLREGMTKDQVRVVLGTPLLQDAFRSNRWDYISTLKRGTGEFSRAQLSVYFEGDVLQRWSAENLPKTASQAVDLPPDQRRPTK